MILMGSYCLFTPAVTGLDIGYVIGFAMLIDGIGRIIQWFSVRKNEKESGWVLASAIISLVLGIFLVINGFAQFVADLFIACTVALWILASGIIRIVRSLRIRKIRKGVRENINENTEFGKSWWVYLILGILLTVYGIFCMIYPLVSLTAVGIFIGIGIVMSGVNLIYLGTSPLIF